MNRSLRDFYSNIPKLHVGAIEIDDYCILIAKSTLAYNDFKIGTGNEPKMTGSLHLRTQASGLLNWTCTAVLVLKIGPIHNILFIYRYSKINN